MARAKSYDDNAAAYKSALEQAGIDVLRGVTLPEDLPENMLAQIFDPKDEDAPKPTYDLTADRVRYISQLMVRGLYRRAHPEVLAKKWGLTKERVKSMAAEADRYIRIYSARDQEETMTELNSIGHKALQMAMESGQLGAVAQLLRVIGDFSLDKRSQKIDVRHEVRNLTDEELERKRAALAQKLVSSLPAEQKKLLLEAPDAEFIEQDKVPIDEKDSSSH